MDIRSAPLLPPALAFVSGAALSFQPSHLSIPLLVSLLAVSLLPGRRAGSALFSWSLRHLLFPLTLGLLWTAVREDLPRSEDPGWHPERPVTAVVATAEPWRRSRHGWSARVEIQSLRQASRPGGPPHIDLRTLPAYLSLPGDEPAPAPGSRLRVRGYLRRNPGLDNHGPRDPEPGPWRLSTPSRRFLEVEEEPGWLARVSHRARGRLEAILDTAEGAAPDGGSPGAALARALVLGDPSRLDPTIVRGLRRSGLGHLLALSGLHLGLMAGLAWMLAALCRLSRSGRWLLVLAAVGLYVLVAGPRASLLRAAVLVAAGVASLSFERPPSPSNALALAMILLTAYRPTLVGDLGFQLTMAATFGLLVLAPWWRGPVREARGIRGSAPWARVLGVSLTTSLAAQVATLPWAVPTFHGISPLAPLLNLVAIPWTALALSVSVLWLGVAAIAPALGAATLPLLDGLAAPGAWPARAPASGAWFLPLDLSAPAAFALALGVAVLLGLPARWRQTRKGASWRRGALASVGLAALGMAAYLVVGAREPRLPDPRLVVLDVGQGEALLIQDGLRAVLVDGGGFPGGHDFGGGIGSRVLLPALLRLGVRRLDAVALTHPDRDHCGGLVELGSWLPVAEVWTVAGWEGEPCVDALVATPGTVHRQISAGGRGWIGGWHWMALHPTRSPQARPGPEGPERVQSLSRPRRNGGSLVLALSVGKGSGARKLRVLLTGDLDAAAEAELLQRFRGPARRLLRAEVLKIAHHGSRGSSSLPFLAAVWGSGGSRGLGSPRPTALISCGARNAYGHPAPEVLERLRRWDARVRRTDELGQVQVRVRPGSQPKGPVQGACGMGLTTIKG